MGDIRAHINQPYYINLSFEQKLLFYAAVIQRKSLFFSGSAGTGKSHLLRAIIKGLNHRGDTDGDIIVTAPTGTAAVNVSGCTIQSFAGFLGDNIKSDGYGDILARVRRNKQSRQRWITTSVLIIDECSMLQGSYFDCLEYVARSIQSGSASKQFFGGIQVILCGDFLQLPPVVKNGASLVWLFESSAFQSIPLKASLTHCFRQSEESFITLLNETRIGHVSAQTDSLLRTLLIQEEQLNMEHDRIAEDAYKAYSTELKQLKEEIKRTEEEQQFAVKRLEDVGNDVVFRHNLLHFIRINRKRCELDAKKTRTTYVSPTFPVRLYTHRAAVDDYNNDNLQKGKNAIFKLQAYDETVPEGQTDPPAMISLAIGAQVIITKNIDVQHGLCNGRQCVVKDIFYFQDGDGRGTRRRAASDINRSNLNGSVRNAIREVTLNVGTQMVVVEVQIGKRVQQIHPFTYELKRGGDKVIGKRIQIPLGLAYALSIHKCQGMTLDNAIINVANAFSPGQAYVALSRLRSIGGIKLTGYTRGRIRADEKALAFHDALLRLDLNDPGSIQANGLWSIGTELCKWDTDRKEGNSSQRGYKLLPQYKSLDDAFVGRSSHSSEAAHPCADQRDSCFASSGQSSTALPFISKPSESIDLFKRPSQEPVLKRVQRLEHSLEVAALVPVPNSASMSASASSLAPIFSTRKSPVEKNSNNLNESSSINIVDLVSSQNQSEDNEYENAKVAKAEQAEKAASGSSADVPAASFSIFKFNSQPKQNTYPSPHQVCPSPECISEVPQEPAAQESTEAKQVFTVEMFLPHLYKLIELEENKKLKMKPSSLETVLQKQKQFLSMAQVQSQEANSYFSEATPFKPADTFLLK